MVLFINGCPRENSRTLELAKTVLSRENTDYRQLDLFPDAPPGLDPESLALREELAANKDFDHPMFRWAREFREADTVVLAAPYWDMLFPAAVRAYLEAVMVNNLTFYYDETGPRSLCRAKRLIYVTTAGGPIVRNFGFEYVESLARAFYGIADVRLVKAEGLDIWGADPAEILAQAKRDIPKLLNA